jgi:hypothetical protein
MSAGSTDVGQYNGGDEFYGKISKVMLFLRPFDLRLWVERA